METPIGTYLDDYTLLDQPGVPAQLYDIVQTYPWFTLGRYMQMRSLRSSDPAGYRRALRRADVRLFIHPWPRLLLDDPAVVPSDYDPYGPTSGDGYTDPVRPDTETVIDEFLENMGAGERIVPPPIGTEMYPGEDISASSVAEDDGIATETLAEIYLAQGLPDRAIEIYSKLSLKYPEKSVYFADLIAEVQARYGGR